MSSGYFRFRSFAHSSVGRVLKVYPKNNIDPQALPSSPAHYICRHSSAAPQATRPHTSFSTHPCVLVCIPDAFWEAGASALNGRTRPLSICMRRPTLHPGCTYLRSNAHRASSPGAFGGSTLRLRVPAIPDAACLRNAFPHHLASILRSPPLRTSMISLLSLSDPASSHFLPPMFLFLFCVIFSLRSLFGVVFSLVFPDPCDFFPLLPPPSPPLRGFCALPCSIPPCSLCGVLCTSLFCVPLLPPRRPGLLCVCVLRPSLFRMDFCPVLLVVASTSLLVLFVCFKLFCIPSSSYPVVPFRDSTSLLTLFVWLSVVQCRVFPCPPVRCFYIPPVPLVCGILKLFSRSRVGSFLVVPLGVSTSLFALFRAVLKHCPCSV